LCRIPQGHEWHGGWRAPGVVPSQQEGCYAANARSEECGIRVWREQQPTKLDQAICTAGHLQDPESQVSEAHGATLLRNGHFVLACRRLAHEEHHLCAVSRRKFVAVTQAARFNSPGQVPCRA